MRALRVKALINLVVLVVPVLVGVSVTAQVRYRVVTLPTPSVLGSYYGLHLSDISDGGSLVGTILVHSSSQGFLWQKSSGIDFLPALGGACSYAMGVNNLNHVAGAACLPGDNVQHAALWKAGKVLDLDTFGGAGSHAFRVNRYDDVVGTYTLVDGTLHGFLWQEGTWVDVGSLGGSTTYATDVNDFTVSSGTPGF
jgi:probable HAF family extracellular repeat protein